MTTNTFYEPRALAPLQGAVGNSYLTGGLRYAPTSGYFRATLRVVNPSSFLAFPFHMLVCAHVFDDDKTEALVKAAGIVIEDEDHVAKSFARTG